MAGEPKWVSLSQNGPTCSHWVLEADGPPQGSTDRPLVRAATRPLCRQETPLLPRLTDAPHIPPCSHSVWNPSVGQEGQESPGGWVQVVGYEVGGPQVVGWQVAGCQVASCGSWQAGLGSGADTRSQYHSPDCQRPETFNPGVVPHCPTALSISATPPTNGPGCLLDQWSASGSWGPGPSPPHPSMGSGGPFPSKTPPGPHPAALRPQEVPALSTPGCIGSYSHLPAGVRLGVINHQLQGLPLVGLDEREEVLGL